MQLRNHNSAESIVICKATQKRRLRICILNKFQFHHRRVVNTMAINFEKKASKQKVEVPSSSLADIVFILLIFFMVSTVLRNVKLKVRINYPQANNIEKIEQKRKLAYIYVGPERLGQNKYGET